LREIRSGSRPIATTRNPALARPQAAAKPIPEVAPVTTATGASLLS